MCDPLPPPSEASSTSMSFPRTTGINTGKTPINANFANDLGNDNIAKKPFDTTWATGTRCATGAHLIREQLGPRDHKQLETPMSNFGAPTCVNPARDVAKVGEQNNNGHLSRHECASCRCRKAGAPCTYMPHTSSSPAASSSALQCAQPPTPRKAEHVFGARKAAAWKHAQQMPIRRFAVICLLNCGLWEDKYRKGPRAAP